MKIQPVAAVYAGLILVFPAAAFAADAPGKQAPKTFEQANAQARQQMGEATLMGLKPGAGRGLVMANCIGCHSPRLIAQHHLSRKRWEETMGAMKKHGLWTVPPAIKQQILDYLSETQGPLGDEEFRETPWAQPLYRPNPLWK